MPPSAPPAIGSNHTPGTPTAPPAIRGDHTPGTPSAPPAIRGNHTPGTPTAPPAVGTAGGMAVRDESTLRVGGALTTDGSTLADFPDLLDAGVLNETNVWTDNGGSEGLTHYCQWSSSNGRWEVWHDATSSVWRSAVTTLLATPTPDRATGWAAVSPATGVPVLTFAGLAAPPAIGSNHTPGTPSAPPAIS